MGISEVLKLLPTNFQRMHRMLKNFYEDTANNRMNICDNVLNKLLQREKATEVK